MPYMGVGRNLSYKRDVFLRNKGFSSINHIPSGDDDLFINKVATAKNTRIVIDQDAVTLSEPKKTWGEWVRQKTRHFSTAKYYKPKHKFLLGLYTISQFLFYPLFISSFFFFDWKWVITVFALRFLSQAFIYYKCMQQLNEKDLWPFWWLMDIWMFLFYIIFAPSLWKRPRANWN